jgi:VWFA-related protein
MTRNTINGAFFLILFASRVTSAQVTPTPIQSGTVFKTSSELVVLDVVVTDPHRDPIHHLAASDFTIFENSKPQTIKVFEEHAADIKPQNAPVPMPKLQPGKFTNFTPAPASGAINILLLDMLNTPLQAQSVIRSEALNFFKEMRPGTQMAIFALNTRLSLVQGFTSDPSLLRTQLESKKGNPTPSRMLVDPMSGEQPGVPDDLSKGAPADIASATAPFSQQSDAARRSALVQLRARITLDAMNQLARYLSNIPGRKNLIWFSSSFPIIILPDLSIAPIDPFEIEVSTQDILRKTSDIMALSRVAVYPVSPGLATMPMFSAEAVPLSGPAIATAERHLTEQKAAEAATMYQIAKATGGKAFVNTNGLKDAVEEAIRDGSNYYTLAYTPTDPTQKSDYRKIEVKLDKPKAALDYRRGYYAQDPDKAPQQVPAARPAGPQYSAMRAAMVHGSPQPTQIILVTDVRPSVPGTEPAAASGNQPARGVSGPFRRYTVTFMTTPGEMNCAASHDGLHHCAMEFLTFVFDANGTRVNLQTSALSFDVPADRFAWLQTQSFSYSQQISVPVKGEYFLRLGMQNLTDGRVGVVELPVSEIAKLPALSEGVSGPAAATSPK